MKKAISANPNTNVVVYDDFNYTNVSDYFNKWFSYEFIPFFNIEPQAIQTRSFGGKLHLQATPFTRWMDDVLDHPKYLAQSTKNFPIPQPGSITFSADIEAQTPGTDPNKLICPTGIDPITQPEKCKKVLEGQQAAATLHMLNIHETGQLFDWLVSEHKSFALTERLLAPLAPGIGLDKGYTQVVPGLGFDRGQGTHLTTLPQQLGEYEITRVRIIMQSAT